MLCSKTPATQYGQHDLRSRHKGLWSKKTRNEAMNELWSPALESRGQQTQNKACCIEILLHPDVLYSCINMKGNRTNNIVNTWQSKGKEQGHNCNYLGDNFCCPYKSSCTVCARTMLLTSETIIQLCKRAPSPPCISMSAARITLQCGVTK